MTQARPFLKYLGGKTALLPQLLPRVPADHTYVEPFLGGGALFFALQPKNAYLSDSNERLIATYRAVRDDVEAVIDGLTRTSRLYGDKPQKYYYFVREQFNEPEDNDLTRAVGMILLNKTGFNGLYRENKSGGFNVPWGKRATFTVDADNLRACSRALQGVELACCDFATAMTRAAEYRPPSFVYCDPPYVPVSASADFTSYTAAGFGPTDQIRLRDWVLWLKQRGVHVMLSNADLPSVRTLYSGFNLESVHVRRNVNRDGKKRGPVGELIIT